MREEEAAYAIGKIGMVERSSCQTVLSFFDSVIT
jgi:hypothetical protein